MEIVMSKFKVGDRVKCVAGVDCFAANHGADYGVVSFVNSNGTFINIDGHAISWNVNKFELVQGEWTIYNNDKPLSELTDEQRGILLVMLCNDSPVQYKINGEWEDRPKGNSLINTNSTYRAKQKSERELFIEAAMLYVRSDGDERSMFEDMFEDGFKAPKDGE
jgi:hypothetical protein